MPQRGTNKQKQHLIRTYSKDWYEKMVEIWRDRLDVMGIRDTGALRSSVKKGTFNIEDAGGAMTYLYLTYGIYVDLGVGNGYRLGNDVTCRSSTPSIATSTTRRSPALAVHGSMCLGLSPRRS
ncbi:MAG: hypothetical protein IKH52_06495 [Bacteroidaceae bacterium]|nr:hypothetical protein [Bacteroidaceae bacterium]